MSVRLTATAFEARLFEAEEPDRFEPYAAFCTIHRMGNVAHVSGLNGKVTRVMLRDLVRGIQDLGVEIVYLERGPGRVMPYAREVLGGDLSGFWRVELGDVAQHAGSMLKRMLRNIADLYRSHDKDTNMEVQLNCAVTQNGAPFLSNSATYSNVNKDTLEYIIGIADNGILPHVHKHAVGAAGNEFHVTLSCIVDGVSAGPDTVASMNARDFYNLERKLANLILQMVDDTERGKKLRAAGKSNAEINADTRQRHGWK